MLRALALALACCGRLSHASRSVCNANQAFRTPRTLLHTLANPPTRGDPRQALARNIRCGASTMTEASITYLNQNDAVLVDEELMGPLGFSVDQLMELAGLSVACSLAAEYPKSKYKSVLVVAGPGNNGGDGLVAARHLHHFGYDVKILYPKPTDKPLYNGLVTQCNALGIEFISIDDFKTDPVKSKFDVLIDAIFGFSFKGSPRPPFDTILESLKPDAKPCPIVSVDVPSGWAVEAGDESGNGIRPDMLVSLTAPKMCARSFSGSYHYLGGRFVPPAIKEKYNLELPEYPSSAQCVRIQASQSSSISDMRLSYEKGTLDETQVTKDPIEQFKAWFSEASQEDSINEPNAMTLATSDQEGKPSARVVLLKGVDERGFIFYTNFNSRKGFELLEGGHAALCFFWEPLQRQVRVEGPVEKLPESESEAYFNSRPRSSRIGAWASNQSSAIENRSVLEQKAEELEEKYKDEALPVPKPPHWGGFLVRPTSVEFWQGRPSRLHDRLRFRRMHEDNENEWTVERLAP